jgi:hypothetical protein
VRFANNTFVFRGGAGFSAIRAMFKLESVEMYNNAFCSFNSPDNMVFAEDQLKWAAGARKVFGSHNWVQNLKDIPCEWTDTASGDCPGSIDLETLNLEPSSNSPLLNAGISPAGTNSIYPFPNPLEVPEYYPQRRKLEPGENKYNERSKITVNIGAL